MKDKVNNYEMTGVLAIVQTYEMNMENLRICYKEAFVRMDPGVGSNATRVSLLLVLFLATQQTGHYLVRNAES